MVLLVTVSARERERERESYRKVFGSFKSQKDTAWKKLIDS